MTNNSNNDKIKIGYVVGTVGLKGEIKIFHLADDPDVLKLIEAVIIDDNIYNLDGIRHKKKIPILKLEGINDINTAETLIKKDIFVAAEEYPELPDGSYYIKDLVGLEVISEDDGSKVGTIKNVITGSAHDIYEIETEESKTMLLPAVKTFITEVNIAEGTVKARLPEGIEDIVY